METHLLNSSLDPSAISVQSSLLTSVAFYIQQLIIDAEPRNQTLVCHLPIIAIEDLHPVLRWQTKSLNTLKYLAKRYTTNVYLQPQLRDSISFQ